MGSCNRRNTRRFGWVSWVRTYLKKAIIRPLTSFTCRWGNTPLMVKILQERKDTSLAGTVLSNSPSRLPLHQQSALHPHGFVTKSRHCVLSGVMTVFVSHSFILKPLLPHFASEFLLSTYIPLNRFVLAQPTIPRKIQYVSLSSLFAKGHMIDASLFYSLDDRLCRRIPAKSTDTPIFQITFRMLPLLGGRK